MFSFADSQKACIFKKHKLNSPHYSRSPVLSPTNRVVYFANSAAIHYRFFAGKQLTCVGNFKRNRSRQSTTTLFPQLGPILDMVFGVRHWPRGITHKHGVRVCAVVSLCGPSADFDMRPHWNVFWVVSVGMKCWGGHSRFNERDYPTLRLSHIPELYVND